MTTDPMMPGPVTEDYARIARAIAHLAGRFPDPVPLAALAAEAGLSLAHFQKTFTRLVGVSPKKLHQHLALDRALEALGSGASVLDAAYEAGLSGPGRLHDLLIVQQAMTPGEAKTRGRGLSIRYGFGPSPLGEVLIGRTARGIAALSFVGGKGRSQVLDALEARWPGAAFTADPAGTAGVVQAVFARFSAALGQGRAPLSLHLLGTRHQLRVWRALLAIPPGTAESYGALAARCGAARGAARAVAGAVAANPIAVLIPCHRVLRASGALGGYAWGLPRKRALLAWEAALAEASASERMVSKRGDLR